MDRNFLLFLGNFFTNAARGQEQLDAMVKWMQEGFKGSDEMTALFKKSYGLDIVSESQAASFKVWEKAVSDFQKSFADFLALFSVVPLHRYTDLLAQHEALKKKAAEQEETISHLRGLLGQRNLHQEALHRGYRELIEKQTDDFQKLLEGMAGAFTAGTKKEEPTPLEKSPSRKKERTQTPFAKCTTKS